MWELWHEAAEHHVAWAADDLLVAISELGLGPWRHASEVDPVVGLPFTVRCTLLDAMLAELLRVTLGFGARVAMGKARGWLDPDRRSQPRRPS